MEPLIQKGKPHDKLHLTAEPGIPLITATKEFDAPREILFRAHTDPVARAVDLGPRDLPWWLIASRTVMAARLFWIKVGWALRGPVSTVCSGTVHVECHRPYV